MVYEPAVLHNSERKVLTLYFGTKEKWIGTLSTIRNTPITMTDAETSEDMQVIGWHFVVIFRMKCLWINKLFEKTATQHWVLKNYPIKKSCFKHFLEIYSKLIIITCEITISSLIKFISSSSFAMPDYRAVAIILAIIILLVACYFHIRYFLFWKMQFWLSLFSNLFGTVPILIQISTKIGDTVGSLRLFSIICYYFWLHCRFTDNHHLWLCGVTLQSIFITNYGNSFN